MAGLCGGIERICAKATPPREVVVVFAAADRLSSREIAPTRENSDGWTNSLAVPQLTCTVGRTYLIMCAIMYVRARCSELGGGMYTKTGEIVGRRAARVFPVSHFVCLWPHVQLAIRSRALKPPKCKNNQGARVK